jgi:hypothetical protein
MDGLSSFLETLTAKRVVTTPIRAQKAMRASRPLYL